VVYVVERFEVRAEADGDVVAAKLQVGLVSHQLAVGGTEAAQNITRHHSENSRKITGSNVGKDQQKVAENKRTC